jgi:uncharacterized protein YodC (DUF2158 family)
MAESASKFKTGDIVKLKSGGPTMTVGAPVPFGLKGDSNPNLAQCFWFHGTEIKSKTFPVEALELVTADEPGV